MQTRRPCQDSDPAIHWVQRLISSDIALSVWVCLISSATTLSVWAWLISSDTALLVWACLISSATSLSVWAWPRLFGRNTHRDTLPRHCRDVVKPLNDTFSCKSIKMSTLEALQTCPHLATPLTPRALPSATQVTQAEIILG